MSRNLSFFFFSFSFHIHLGHMCKKIRLNWITFSIKKNVKYAMSVDKFPDWIFEFCTRLTNDLTMAKISVGPHFFFSVCAIYFVFGVVCAFFGYRCFKAIMFLYGFIFGSIVVYLICVEEKVLPGMNIIKVILIEK